MTCQHCGGSGELTSTYRERNKYYTTRVNCSHCSGQGRIEVPGINDHVAGEPLKPSSTFSLIVSYEGNIEPYHTETTAQFAMGALRFWSGRPSVTSVFWIAIQGESKYTGRVPGPAATAPMAVELPVNLPEQTTIAA